MAEVDLELAEILETVRRRRADLYDDLATLERAIAAPAPGREPAWGNGVAAALGLLRAELAAHVELNEGGEGLHAEVVVDAPRLAHAVERLVKEHRSIEAALEAATQVATDRPEGRDDRWVAEVREACTRLLGLLARHRQRGADLVYEAYGTDVGGET